MMQYSGPFQVMTGTGPKIVLPNRFAEEIRNNPSLNFPKAFSKVCTKARRGGRSHGWAPPAGGPLLRRRRFLGLFHGLSGFRAS